VSPEFVENVLVQFHFGNSIWIMDKIILRQIHVIPYLLYFEYQLNLKTVAHEEQWLEQWHKDIIQTFY
jgi:hypothetical protein